MKFKKKYLAILAIISTLTIGCEDFKFGNDFLEAPIGGSVNLDTIFSKKVHADQFLNQVYMSLPDYMGRDRKLNWKILESITDLCDVPRDSPTWYHTGTISADPEAYRSMAYRMDWGGDGNEGGSSSAIHAFRSAHIYIDNIDKVSDMSNTEKTTRKGEAKMIMAQHWVDIFRNLGGMPWINKAYTPEDDMTMTRMTIKEAVTNTSKLIDDAVEMLPWSVEAKDDGRMTAAAGYALKSRMLLYAASPLYNNDKPYRAGEASEKHYVWYGDYSVDRWQDALDAGLAFLDENAKNGNFYRLVDTGNPREDFRKAFLDRYNQEVIISGHRWAKHDRRSHAYVQMRYGNNAPALRYVDMFQMKDGSEFSWDNPEHHARPFFDKNMNELRDPRLYETCWVNEDSFLGRKCELYFNGREGSPENHLTADKASVSRTWSSKGRAGVAIKKMWGDGETINGYPYMCPLLRLPEIYLNIAEAMNELGLANTKDKFGRDAYDYVDLIRNRVDMPGLDKSKIASGVELREAILRERALEFGYEELRYFDITRWKRLDWMQDRVRFLFTEKNDDGSFKHTVINRPVFATCERQWINKWDDRYYLSPIPLEEINKKYGLIQNPGW